MCEIDKAVVEVSEEHFPEHTAGLADPRAKVVFEDGKKYIEDSDEQFDIILLDLSDPVGPAAELFQKAFHQKVHDRLTDNGILVAQSRVTVLQPGDSEVDVREPSRHLPGRAHVHLLHAHLPRRHSGPSLSAARVLIRSRTCGRPLRVTRYAGRSTTRRKSTERPLPFALRAGVDRLTAQRPMKPVTIIQN